MAEENKKGEIVLPQGISFMLNLPTVEETRLHRKKMLVASFRLFDKIGFIEKIFESHISKEAKILTDKWRGYSPITELYNITQEKSEPDTNFKVMHRCVQQLKSWLRDIHYSVNYLQGYGFRRKNNKKTTKISLQFLTGLFY